MYSPRSVSDFTLKNLVIARSYLAELFVFALGLALLHVELVELGLHLVVHALHLLQLLVLLEQLPLHLVPDLLLAGLLLEPRLRGSVGAGLELMVGVYLVRWDFIRALERILLHE